MLTINLERIQNGNFMTNILLIVLKIITMIFQVLRYLKAHIEGLQILKHFSRLEKECIFYELMNSTNLHDMIRILSTLCHTTLSIYGSVLSVY